MLELIKYFRSDLNSSLSPNNLSVQFGNFLCRIGSSLFMVPKDVSVLHILIIMISLKKTYDSKMIVVTLCIRIYSPSAVEVDQALVIEMSIHKWTDPLWKNQILLKNECCHPYRGCTATISILLVMEQLSCCVSQKVKNYVFLSHLLLLLCKFVANCM